MKYNTNAEKKECHRISHKTGFQHGYTCKQMAQMSASEQARKEQDRMEGYIQHGLPIPRRTEQEFREMHPNLTDDEFNKQYKSYSTRRDKLEADVETARAAHVARMVSSHSGSNTRSRKRTRARARKRTRSRSRARARTRANRLR